MNNSRDPKTLRKIDLHYGHWQGTLNLAKEISSQRSNVEERQLSFYSSSIILARTALEIYLNEAWFSLPQINHNPHAYDKFVYTTVVKRYKKYSRACKIPSNDQLKALCADIDLCNHIRNFCIHYTGPHITDRIINAIKKRPEIDGALQNASDSPQTYLLNNFSANFCIKTVAKSIQYCEENRKPHTILSSEYIEHCRKINQ